MPMIDTMSEILAARLSFYEVGDGDHNRLATDLIEWYNRREEDLDLEDVDRLFNLAKEGQFLAWDCPSCDDRCYLGSPSDWGNFQGVHNVDYVSYPVRKRWNHDQCDSCRMHMTPLPNGYLGGRSGH